MPWLANADDERIADVLDRVTVDEEDYDDYRDDLLFDLQTNNDAKLFSVFMVAIGLALNYSVQGHDYIVKKSHNFCEENAF